MKLSNAKGTKDILPEQKILRDSVVDKIKKSFELFGFLPLDTPALEMYETLSSKYAGGSEILKETFKLKDQGNRELGLRYDLTVPLARFIAMNPNIKMPFKRYQIASVWRDGPIKLGRYREFVQCDIDIVGSNSMLADAEIIALTENIFDKLDLIFEIKVNNRKLLNGILESVGIKEKDFNKSIIAIDKYKKYGEKTVKEELNKIKIDDKTTSKLFKILKINGTNEDILIELKQTVKNKNSDEGLEELEELFNYLNLMEVKNIKLETSLARGLDYYTSTIFEVYLIGNKITNISIAAGGRYNKMIGNFMESKNEIPAVGISFGLDVITDAIYDERKIKKTLTKVYIIPIKTLNEPLNLLKKLRFNNINSDIDLNEKGISKNLDYANKSRIPYVIIIGEKELKLNKFKLRDMINGEEFLLNEDELIKKLTNS